MNLKKDLEALGKTEEEVVINLVYLGIKGIPQDNCECPIARYLKSKGYTDVSVCERGGVQVSIPVQISEIGNVYSYHSYRQQLYPLPEAIESFIHFFDKDSELYPELLSAQ